MTTKRKQPDIAKLLLSSEKEFIHREAHNKGFVQTPRMVVNCLDLSDQAKQIYGAIATYVFEHGRAAFPSVDRLGMQSNCSDRRAFAHIKELVDKGFIVKIRKGGMKPNDYFMVDMDKIPHLRVSEMLWSVAAEVQHKTGRTWKDVRIATEIIIGRYKAEGKPFAEIEISKSSIKQLDKTYMEVLGGVEVFDYSKRKRPAKPPVLAEPVKASSAGGRQLSAFLQDPWEQREVENWRNKEFLSYFFAKYQEATGKRLIVNGDNRKYSTIITNCANRLDGDKERLKAHIDAYFAIGYDTPSLESFSANARVPELDAFIDKGVKPFYIDKQVKAKEDKAVVEKAVERKTDKSKIDKLLGGA